MIRRRFTTEEFIKKAKKIHGDKYDYSKVVYQTARNKVEIICPIHGSFFQTPERHLGNHGCQNCGILLISEKKYSTAEEFIKKAKKIHGNKYDYSKVVYLKSAKKVEIICSIHGSFFQTPNSHLGGKGCVNCGNISRIQKQKMTIEHFLKRAKKVHGDKYDYSKVNYKNAHERIEINCPIHGVFLQIPDAHLRGNGCGKCANKFTAKKLSSNTSDFIEKARKVHGDKYDYSKVNYIKNTKKVEIVCSIHGSFFQAPNHHLRGKGCGYCKNSLISEKLRSTTEDFIKKSTKVHGNKYDYSKVVYLKSDKKVEIICPIHGVFLQLPDVHLRGNGCRKCANNFLSGIFSSNTSDFIEKARKVHGDKYDYSKVNYIKNTKKVEIVCSIHGSFFQTPSNHLSGKCCRKCIGRVSNISQRWFEHLNNDNILIEYCVKIGNRNFIFDGYDPTTNTAYEFNGDYWHGNPKLYNPKDVHPVNHKTFGQLYKETKDKERFLKKHGYNVVSIWESDFNELIQQEENLNNTTQINNGWLF